MKTRTRTDAGVSARLAAVMILLLASAPALANYTCEGKIANLTVDSSGTVTIGQLGTSGISWVYLCRTGSSANGITQENCRAILATLMTAYATDSTVYFWFNDALSCTTHPQWDWLTGWYFGPAINK